MPVATQSPVFQALQQPISLAQSTVAQKPVFQAFQPLIQQPAPQPIPQASRLKSLLSPQPVPQKGINVIPALQAIVEPQSESTSSISTWQKSPIESNIKTQVEEMQVEELPPSPSGIINK